MSWGLLRKKCSKTLLSIKSKFSKKLVNIFGVIFRGLRKWPEMIIPIIKDNESPLPPLPGLKFLQVEYKLINYPLNKCCCKEKSATKIVPRQRYPTGINGFITGCYQCSLITTELATGERTFTKENISTSSSIGLILNERYFIYFR